AGRGRHTRGDDMAGPMGSRVGARLEHRAGAGAARRGAGRVHGGEDAVSGRDVAVTRSGIRRTTDIVIGVRRRALVTVQRLYPSPRSGLVMRNRDVALRMPGRR